MQEANVQVGKKSLKELLDGVPGLELPVADVVLTIAAVSQTVAHRIAQGDLEGALNRSVGMNSDGDVQKTLDVFADEAFADRLRQSRVKWLASEERETIEPLNPEGTLAVAIDPLDGSSNIGLNISVGTIFSVFRATPTANDSFMRPGREQLCSGYILYGPQTAMILAVGEAVAYLVFCHRNQAFEVIDADLKIPAGKAEFAINGSNARHWDAPVRCFIDDCLLGEKGPLGIDFNMRWVASLVAETHRILMRGGVFLYPADARPGYNNGRLRMLYEATPISGIIELAGGMATDGREPVLDKIPQHLHQRTPFVFGATEWVNMISDYHAAPSRHPSPLFGERGLYTA